MTPVDTTFCDRAAYFPSEDTLVVADLHIGRDASSGVELPLGERADLLERLDALLGRFDPAAVVAAGDVLHAFDRLPDGAVDTLGAFCERVGDAGADLTMTPGNHDAMLETALDAAAVDTATVTDEYRIETVDAVVVHGHERPDAAGTEQTTALYVCGHDHPAIRIEGQRRPCYLYGSGVYENSDVLALPAFSRLAAGAVVNRARRGDLQSPLLADPGRFRPAVRDEDADETLWFPPLDEFRSML
jgi:putative SbcD/Mre11-related phosphoesterase